MKLLPTLAFILASLTSHAQTCEPYDRKLFHMLSDNVPDKINCIDARGLKQGWWIYYKVSYNPKKEPDVLDSGNYVDQYTYGKYQDDRKIGYWKTVENVHIISERRVDSFRYSGDTITVFSEEPLSASKAEYIKADSLINSVVYGRKDTVYINCQKQRGCTMLYQGNVFKRFPQSDFELHYKMALEEVEFSKDNWEHKTRTKRANSR